MPAPSGNSALPALRFYAQVESDGTTPNINSGVTVIKTVAPAGTYRILLPTNQGIPQNRQMVFVQPRSSSIAIGATYQWVNANEIQVNTFDTATPDRSDVAFDIFIFTPTLPSEID